MHIRFLEVSDMQKNMRNFTYYTPTKVVFGKDAELQVAKLIQAEKCRKVLVHFGGKSL